MTILLPAMLLSRDVTLPDSLAKRKACKADESVANATLATEPEWPLKT